VGETPVRRLTWTPELVERFWAGVSQTRLSEYSFSRQAGKSLMIAVEHHLSHDARVLDYGAGDGELVELLLDRGYRVAAYEPSTSRGDRLLRLVGGQQRFLGVLDGKAKQQFDVVFMIEVIEHILDQDLDDALQRMRDLLKNGGTLIVTTPNNEDLELGMVYCPVSNMLFHRWQHVRSFTAESLTALLRHYDISPVVVHHLEFRSDSFVPFDRHWGGDRFISERPSHLEALRADVPVRHGSESNLLFIGRKNRAAVWPE